MGEESLLHLAALPFVREFSPLGGGWRVLERERLVGHRSIRWCVRK